ncbi:MAG: sulfite exporter TauE/SafE family protein, partial [Solirubrobacteraceae bacterium]
MEGLDPGTIAALAVFGLVAGIGITALGPGGVLVTVGLFLLTDLSPEAVAGTAIVTHIATGVVGTLAYGRSGHLGDRDTRRAAVILAAVAVLGTPLGVLVNGAVSGSTFAVLLGIVTAATGVLVWVRERRVRAVDERPLPPVLHPSVVAAVGLGVATAAGMFGLGGPMLAVPLLVAFGVPVLAALAAAQVQSVVIATVGTVGY